MRAPSASPKSQHCFCAGWPSTSTASANGAPPGAVSVLACLHFCLLNLSSQGAAHLVSRSAPQQPESCACLDTRTVHRSRLQARHAVLEALWQAAAHLHKPLHRMATCCEYNLQVFKSIASLAAAACICPGCNVSPCLPRLGSHESISCWEASDMCDSSHKQYTSSTQVRDATSCCSWSVFWTAAIKEASLPLFSLS